MTLKNSSCSVAVISPRRPAPTVILSIERIGVNSLGIGVLGEYLGRTYAEAKRRPLYVIAESTNIPEDQLPLAGVSER